MTLCTDVPVNELFATVSYKHLSHSLDNAVFSPLVSIVLFSPIVTLWYVLELEHSIGWIRTQRGDNVLKRVVTIG